jgi:hypothetical protein
MIGINEIFDDRDIIRLSTIIANELDNRNMSAIDAGRFFVSKNILDDLISNCATLYSIVRDIIKDDAAMANLANAKPEETWKKMALFLGRTDKGIDKDKVALHICISLISKHHRKIDEYILALPDKKLYDALGIISDDDQLIDLTDPRLELRRQGVIFNGSTLFFPHQFFRRSYRYSILGVPASLKKAIGCGASVKIRIDPFRVTTADRYREIMELDYWYGARFSEKLLCNTRRSERTLHISTGFYELNYDARFTAIRTKMMDDGIREFMIEEYCPQIIWGEEKSPGTGEKFCIQKFAHFCYDQRLKTFTHLDGAVRVFENTGYESIFKMIESGKDIGDKAGVRHKMFLVEGRFKQDLVQELLSEWFRYNPHIHEYFSGKNIPPNIPYEKFAQIYSK